MTTQIELAALDGGGRPITLRADQNTDTSIAMRASMEIGGSAVATANPVPVVSVGGVTITQTVVALSANDAASLIAANPLRRYLAIQVLAGGDVTLGFPSAVAGAGWRLTAGGDPLIWGSASLVPLQAIGGISASGSTVVILEGA